MASIYTDESSTDPNRDIEEGPPEYAVTGYMVPDGYTKYVKLAKVGTEEITSISWILFCFKIATIVISALYYYDECNENLQLFMILCAGGSILSVANRCRYKGMEKVQDAEGKVYFVDGDKANSIASMQYTIELYCIIVSIILIKLFFDTNEDQCKDIIYKFAMTNVIIQMILLCFIALILVIGIIVSICVCISKM